MRNLLTIVCLFIASWLNAQPAKITDEGAWCWFADPRATHYENTTRTINASYIGYIDVHGNVKATQVDFIHNRQEEVLVRSCFQPDDHNNPTFLVLPDERVMIFYTRHTDEPRIWYRISTKPGDITQLGEEKYITVANNTTYPSPFIMSDDPHHIYICWRGINWHPTIARITMPDANDNVTVDFGPKQIVQSTGARPYAKYQTNGKDKIYVSYTTGHPDNEMPNWLYFNVIDINRGNGPILKDVKGNTLKRVADGVFNVSKTDSYRNSYPYTVVDNTASIRNWVWQIALDKEEKPVIAYTHIDDAKTSHVYWYGRWTGTEWRRTWVQYAGHAFHQNWNSTERCYTGGAAIDPDNINDLYLSIPTTNGQYNRDGVYEIWKFQVGDDGKVGASEQLTKSSLKNNVRPFILPNSANSPLRLTWMNGDYYYWMVNKNYPKGYPTSIYCDNTIPQQPVNLQQGLVNEVKGGKELKGNTDLSLTGDETIVYDHFSAVISANLNSQSYKGCTFFNGSVSAKDTENLAKPKTRRKATQSANSLSLTLDAQGYLCLTVGNNTYRSACRFYNSDNWAANSTGTSGDSWPTEYTTINLTITYDGKQMTIYRNGVIEIRADVAEQWLSALATGGWYGTLGIGRFYERALSQEEVKASADNMSLASINIPESIYTDLVLPASANGKDITWTSNQTRIITNTGLVSNPDTPTTVTLTATTESGSVTFDVTVYPRDIEHDLLLQYDFAPSDLYSDDANSRYVVDKSGNERNLRIMGSAQVDGTLNLMSNSPVAFATNGYAIAPAGVLKGVRSYTFIFDALAHNRTKLPRFYDFGSGSGNSVFLRLTNNYKYSAGAKCNGGTTLMVEASGQMPQDQMQHLAVTFDAKTKKTTIYVNGAVAATGTNVTYEPYHLVNGDNDLRNYIGRTQWWDNNSDNGDLVGRIDNFRLYDIALTQEEIANLNALADRIETIPTQTLQPHIHYYNILGQRISHPQKGIYLVGGKKMVGF